ncbi:multicopper oxidase domain-containing protein [Prauserella oleivorans]
MTAPHRRISRRGFLILGAGVTTAAGLAACTSRNASPPAPTRIGPKAPSIAAAERNRRATSRRSTSVSLEAGVTDIDLGGIQVKTWTYGGELPGKEIRVRRGDVLNAQLSNKLPQPTTIHWHGLALRNDMDGVPVLTQSEIKPGTSFTYDFAVPDAGTYWFHPTSARSLTAACTPRSSSRTRPTAPTTTPNWSLCSTTGWTASTAAIRTRCWPS